MDDVAINVRSFPFGGPFEGGNIEIDLIGIKNSSGTAVFTSDYAEEEMRLNLRANRLEGGRFKKVLEDALIGSEYVITGTST